MFQVGERIIYGSRGVCEIEDVTCLKREGIPEDRVYYILKPLWNKDSTIMTPVDNDRIVMRSLITKDEAERLISEMPAIEEIHVPEEKQREQIYVPVLSFGYPCKVIDTAGIGIDVLTLHVYAFYFFKHAGKEFLRMEHFMAAAEGFDRGKNIVQHLGAYAHGICEVDNPCIGTDFFYFASEPFIDGNCTHCTQHSAGAYGVTD